MYTSIYVNINNMSNSIYHEKESEIEYYFQNNILYFVLKIIETNESST